MADAGNAVMVRVRIGVLLHILSRVVSQNSVLSQNREIGRTTCEMILVLQT